MNFKREYSILPQAEKDDFHHHVREGSRPITAQYICLCTVITVTIVIILTGIAALTASMFYSDQISTTYRNFWYSYESITPNDTNNTSMSNESSFKGGSKNETTYVPQRNSTDYSSQSNKTVDNHHHNHHQHSNHNNNSDNSFTTENYSDGDSKNTTRDDDSSEESSNNSTMITGGRSDKDIINVDELKEKFAETMRDFVEQMENITGIRKAEFVIPIFMLICFLTLFSFISLCCCVMMRRRDNRRRKLFGKLITDLQTGDSKTVLLNHSDLDD